MRQQIADIMKLFDLQDEGDRAFLGRQPDDGGDRLRVYGGQVAAKATTTSGRCPKSPSPKR